MGGFNVTIPNQSGAIFGPTAGISRNMQLDMPEPRDVPSPETQGGGDLNGTSATSILMYQAGTNATRWQMPRKAPNPGNYCGVI